VPASGVRCSPCDGGEGYGGQSPAYWPQGQEGIDTSLAGTDEPGPNLPVSRLLEITSKTVDSFWDGEAMDVHLGVDALLTYDDDSSDEE
jgi:hypothetical protein